MGRNKAFLPYQGGVLASYVADCVRAAAGDVTLIGDPATYAAIGYPVIPDLTPGAGPLGGIHTALRHTCCDWNLVVACDMPGISTEFLSQLMAAAARSAPGALIPVTGPERLPEP